MQFLYLPKYNYQYKEINVYGFVMVSLAYSSKIWPQYESVMNLQLNISSDVYCLTACSDNASSVQMILFWICIILYSLGASPSPSPGHLPSTQTVLWANWDVLPNSNWRACSGPAMLVPMYSALWGKFVVLCRHSVLWLIDLLLGICFSSVE